MSITAPDSANGPFLDLTLPESEDAMSIRLRNKTTSKSLALNLPDGWDGDDLVLDFAARTIKNTDGDDLSSLLDAVDNTLWTPEPVVAGSNDLDIRAVNLSDVSSQTKSPGTVADKFGIGTVLWSSPSNAKASDDSRATTLLEAFEESHYLLATNYGFTIPEGAEIVGVKPSVEKSGTLTPALVTRSVRLSIGGSFVGTDQADSDSGWWPTTDATATFGGSGDLWQTPITRANVNASTFGFAIAVRNAVGQATARIDHMPITVYYAEPATYGAEANFRWEVAHF